MVCGGMIEEELVKEKGWQCELPLTATALSCFAQCIVLCGFFLVLFSFLKGYKSVWGFWR